MAVPATIFMLGDARETRCESRSGTTWQRFPKMPLKR
jgi:hypothetical protein